MGAPAPQNGLLRVSRRLLGARLWGAALRGSFYGHFVGGETPAQLQGTADRLRVLGLRPLLALPAEDGGQHGGEPWFEANGRAALACVGLAAGTGPRAMMQLKVTALLSARLCETLSQRAEEPGSELSVERVMAALGGEAPAFSCLSPADNAQLGAALQRLERVAAHAASRGVRLLLDAEQSELRAALTLLGLALMGRHNRAAPWVWHTQQAYLRDAVGDLGAVLSQAQRLGACVGLKLVRGAYLQHERGRGAALPSRRHTDRSYGQCLELALARAARDGGRLELMVATHNEGSVQLAAR
ncbi:hydroxyproline dehydrogenase-like, partial [Cygnus atratus]|uniref:hydroxyproline dehydrogenase-like n=1 Tax=Cygnus atratus TaxID=8868 RepID=UPI0021B7AC33